MDKWKISVTQNNCPDTTNLENFPQYANKTNGTVTGGVNELQYQNRARLFFSIFKPYRP